MVKSNNRKFGDIGGAGEKDFGANPLLFANMYATEADLPSATTYHGMFAHVHATGRAYYSHAGNWIKLVEEDSSGNIAVTGTVDGRDLSTDGTKLDGIETGATADQTAAEIRTLVESATDSNVFTDADHTKLNAIEDSATGDQTDAEIKIAYENNSDTNAFTDALQTKLNGIEASATADQTDAEIRAAVEAATDSNVFTDADHTKLNGIEDNATADQTAAEIRTLVDSATDSNVFTDADHTKLNGIEASATADQTAAEIEAIVSHDNLLDFVANEHIDWTTDQGATDIHINNIQASTTSVAGTMSSADKTKLDGIEAAATADQTASEILTAIKTVDGASSGLDADLLDGNEATHFLNTSTSFGGDVSGTYNAIVIADDSHNHTISNVDNLQTTLDAKLALAGGTMAGSLVLHADPTASLQAATKQYVDTIASAGLHYHQPVRVEHPSNLNATYNNGSSGVGATLTNAGSNAAIELDGVTLSLNDRVLVANQTNQAHNGVYKVTTTGDASTAWVLTRTTDTDSYAPSDPDAFGKGDAFFIKEGDTNAGHLDVLSTSGAIVFGTTNIIFSEVAETTVYAAGTGLTLTGTTFSADQAIATTATPTFAGLTVNGNITVTGNVDGRDVLADGTKLDGVETGATADQTDAEIKTAYENNSDTNAFTDALLTKLNGIEASATGDQTAADIEAIVSHDNLQDYVANEHIDWTTDQGASNIHVNNVVAASNSTSGLMSSSDKVKLDAIESNATADQTAAEIEAIVNHDNLLGFVANEHIDWTADQGSTNIDINNIQAATTSVAGSMSSTDKTKLDGIESNATADQSDAEIKTAYENNSDTNAFTDALQTKLNGIASSANNYSHPNHSGDVTSTGDGATTIATSAVTSAKIASNAVTSAKIANNAVTAAKLDQTYLTAHPNINGASDSLNSGTTFIQALQFDSNGHVTNVNTGTAPTFSTGKAIAMAIVFG